MRTLVTRRDCLIGAASAGAAVALPCARAFAQPKPALELVELSERLAVVHGAGANVTVLATDDGLLLVDGGHAQRAEELVALLGRRWPGKPIRDVFNTNWRAEHTGANDALRAAGAGVHAHVNTKLWMGARFEVKWQGIVHEPRPAGALPNHTFYESGSLEVGGAEIRYGHVERAHTDGDVYVHFPDENVFAVSDLLGPERGYPLPDFETGGFIGGMVQATEALLEAADAESRIVPAVGAVRSREALEDQLALCRGAMQQMSATYRAGGTLEDYFAAAEGLGEGRDDPTLFLTLVYDGGYYHSTV